MKVSIGMNLQLGPWGGGNQFGLSLTDYLRNRGIQVFFNLTEPDLDMIVLTGSQGSSAAYRTREVVKYLLFKNWSAIVVHRINECDERKGTTGLNQRLVRANHYTDCTVFISNWLRRLFSRYSLKSLQDEVILNGADSTVFNSTDYKRWNGNSKIKIVTHHWGASRLKGFDIYERLDRMLGDQSVGQKVDFTYVGNLPPGFKLTRAHYVPPKSGVELASILQNHHVYLTASQNEPAGMHHIEGGMCGLPLLYRESGALPEYCRGFGVSFTADNFEQKLLEMIETYNHWVDRMADYPHTAERMCEQYYNLFTKLLDRRNEFIKQRQWWRQPFGLARTLLVG